MNDIIKYVLSVFISFGFLTLCAGYYENSKSAQEIENLERLYRLKTDLQNNKDAQETEKFIEDIERRIDSINKNIK